MVEVKTWGIGYSRNEELVGLELIVLLASELFISLAYFVIPLQLFWFVRQVKVADIFLTVRIWFILFIVCCGSTHFVAFLTQWWDLRRTMVLAKLVTAIVSVATAVVLVQRMEDLLGLMREASELEESVRKSKSQLEVLRERNEELGRLKEEAMKLAKTRQDFISTVSHEVRTPLQSIIGYGEILEQSRLDPSQQQMIRTMLESSRLLCTIINDILDFARYQKEDFTLENEAFSVEEAALSALRISASKAASKNLDLRFKVGSDVPKFVRGDLTRLVQVLSNLISNGVKFTETGHISLVLHVVCSEEERDEWTRNFILRENTYTPSNDLITISEEEESPSPDVPKDCDDVMVQIMNKEEPTEETNLLKDGEDTEKYGEACPSQETMTRDAWGIRFEVQDSGPGIPSSALNKIFHRFVQTDNSTTRKFGGTGLGLAIARQLMNRMGGSIHLESHVGRGSSFNLLLPLKAAQPAEILRASDDFVCIRPPEILMGNYKESAAASESSKEQREQKEASIDDSVVLASLNDENFVDTPQFKALCADVRVLIVDDNEVNRMVTQKLLKSVGVQKTETLNDGKQALIELEKKDIRIDCVLMDLHMPVVDGFAATREIRKTLPHRDGIIIFAFTAATFAPDEFEKLKSDGFSGILAKPCSLNRIKTMMRHLLLLKHGMISHQELFARTTEKFLEKRSFVGSNGSQTDAG